MARLTATFTNFVTVCVVAIHLVLLPALYFGVGYVIRKSHEDLFVQHARTFARVLADEFEVGAAFDSPAKTSDLLDLAIIHGEALYAELMNGDRSIRSSLGSPDSQSSTPHGLELRARAAMTCISSCFRSSMPARAPNCAWGSTNARPSSAFNWRSTACCTCWRCIWAPRSLPPPT